MRSANWLMIVSNSLPAALDLGERGHEPPVAAVQEILDRFALGLEAEATLTLPFGADPVVGHERALGHAEPLTSVSPSVDTDVTAKQADSTLATSRAKVRR